MKILETVRDEPCIARTSFDSMPVAPYESREGSPGLRERAIDGSLVLFRGSSVVSKLIAWVSGSPYSHAGLVLRWGGRVMLIEAVFPAVRVTPLSLAVADYHGIADLYVPRVPLPELTRDKLIGLATAHLAVPFAIRDLALLGLFGAIHRRFVERADPDDDLVCSEFIARVYGLAGVPLVGTKVRSCSDGKCLARPKPTLDAGPAVGEDTYPSSAAPGQLLCSRAFVPAGRFDKRELGQVKVARKKLVESYVEEHRKATRALRAGSPER